MKRVFEYLRRSCFLLPLVALLGGCGGSGSNKAQHALTEGQIYAIMVGPAESSNPTEYVDDNGTSIPVELNRNFTLIFQVGPELTGSLSVDGDSATNCTYAITGNPNGGVFDLDIAWYRALNEKVEHLTITGIDLKAGRMSSWSIPASAVTVGGGVAVTGYVRFMGTQGMIRLSN